MPVRFWVSCSSGRRDSYAYWWLIIALDATWFPYTLRWYYIWIPTTLSLALAVTILGLLRFSRSNNGLSPEVSAMFGWKFAPTLIAVVYTQLTVILFDDVKRTEPFARLAKPPATTPKASKTILETPRQWWTTLAHGLNKNNNGGSRSWVVVCSCIVNILASLAISPLSSALLWSDSFQTIAEVDMVRVVPRDGSMIPVRAERETYLRTMGALLQNITTSAWISDEYVVLPFWPVAENESPWDHRTASTPQTWKAETLVFRNDLKCHSMEQNFTTPPLVWTISFNSTNFQSLEECYFRYSFSWIGLDGGFTYWGDIDDFSQRDYNVVRAQRYHNQCHSDEGILVSTPQPLASTPQTDMKMKSYICFTTYSMATLPVTVTLSNTKFAVHFEQTDFYKNRYEIPPTLFNLSQFQDLYTGIVETYVPTPDKTGTDGLGDVFVGAGALLGAVYEFNLTQMIEDVAIIEKAARIRRRFFGEILRSTLEASDAIRLATSTGKTAAFQRRITVSPETAYVLSALFLLSFTLLSLVTWMSRAQQRPLNLVHDPASVLGIATLVTTNTSVLPPGS